MRKRRLLVRFYFPTGFDLTPVVLLVDDTRYYLEPNSPLSPVGLPGISFTSAVAWNITESTDAAVFWQNAVQKNYTMRIARKTVFI